MVDLTGAYNPDATPSAPSQPIPAGTYVAIIVESETKNSRANPSNRYLALTFEIVSPDDFKKRKLWKNINLWNSNPQAKAIADAEFAAIRIAVGQPSVTRSESLHNIPVELDVRVTKRKDTNELQNEIKGIYLRGHSASKGAPAAATAGDRPW